MPFPRTTLTILLARGICLRGSGALAQDLPTFRTDQFARSQNYVLTAIQPSGRDNPLKVATANSITAADGSGTLADVTSPVTVNVPAP